MWEKAELEDFYADDLEDAGGRRRTVTEEDMLSEMTSQDGTRQAEQRFSGGSSSPGRRSGGEPRPGDPGYREYRMRQYYENTYADMSNSRSIAAKVIEQNKNMIAVKAREPFTEPCSISALESNGRMWTFVVIFDDSPSVLIVDTRERESIGEYSLFLRQDDPLEGSGALYLSL